MAGKRKIVIWTIAGLISALSSMNISLAQEAQSTPAIQRLSMNEAINITLSINPTSLAGAESVRQAEDAVKQAKGQNHFQLTFNSQAGVSNASVIQPPPTGETFGAIQNGLNIPIPLGSKADIIVKQAMQQLSAAEASYRSSELAEAGKVATAYLDLLRKRALVKAAQSDLETAQRELSDAQLRMNAGDIPQLDVLQAQVPISVDQAALLTAQSSESIAAETLNDFLCRPVDQPILLQDVVTPLAGPTYTVEEAREMAVSVSPDVAAADSLVLQDEDAVEAAKRYNDPTLALQAIDLRSRDRTSFSRDDTIQASLTLPISDGGVAKSELLSTQSALSQAKLQAQAVRKAAIVSVSSAYMLLSSSLAEVTATQAALDIAQTTSQKTQLGYSDGLYPLVDALAAEKAAADALTQHIQAVYDAATAWYILDTEVSGPPIVVKMESAKH